MASANAEDEGVVSYDTIAYTYDTRGNILSKTYTLTDGTTETINYGYTDTTWKDRLTSYNGISITADAIGNPLSWHDGSSMSWQHGRQLATHTKSGVTTTYSYDDTGLRTSKTVGNVTTKYYVIDGTMRRMTDGTNTLRFVYGNGLSSVIFNGTEYWYVFNAQGDVIGLIDATGTYVVEYAYDSWGKILSKTGALADTLGTLNPFRYRGYIYDEETGFYYVSSRYYDPEIGRWINADDVAIVSATLSSPFWYKNLYAYCDNNPISRVDYGGYAWETIFDVVTLGISASEVILNPTDVSTWLNLAADAVDLIPFVTGVGEVTRASRIANASIEIADATLDLQRAGIQIGKTIDTYSALKKYTKGTGLEVHHLLEKRFVKRFDIDPNTMLSVVLTKEEHRLYTNLWRQNLPYGKTYNWEDIFGVMFMIYKDKPEYLFAAAQDLKKAFDI